MSESKGFLRRFFKGQDDDLTCYRRYPAAKYQWHEYTIEIDLKLTNDQFIEAARIAKEHMQKLHKALEEKVF